MKRVGYFIQHLHVVLGGLFCFFVPMLSFAFTRNPPLIITLIIPFCLFAFYKAISYGVNKQQLTVFKSVEIMAEAPILLLSIILPILKVGIDIADGATAETTTEATAKTPAEAIGKTNNISEAHSTSETAHSTLSENIKPVNIAKQTTNETITEAIAKSNHISEVNTTNEISHSSLSENIKPTMITELNSPNISIKNFMEDLEKGDSKILLKDNSTMHSSISHNSVTFADMLNEFNLSNEFNTIKISDSNHHTLGYIQEEQSGNNLEIINKHNQVIGYITKVHDGYEITNKHHLTLANIKLNNIDVHNDFIAKHLTQISENIQEDFTQIKDDSYHFSYHNISMYAICHSITCLILADKKDLNHPLKNIG